MYVGGTVGNVLYRGVLFKAFFIERFYCTSWNIDIGVVLKQICLLIREI